MKLTPLKQKRHDAARQIAVNGSASNVDGALASRVPGVKVWRFVLAVVHGYKNAEELTDYWHCNILPNDTPAAPTLRGVEGCTISHGSGCGVGVHASGWTAGHKRWTLGHGGGCRVELPRRSHGQHAAGSGREAKCRHEPTLTRRTPLKRSRMILRAFWCGGALALRALFQSG